LEAPFVSLKITDSGIVRSYSTAGHNFSELSFCVSNHGRTPANIIEIVDKLALLGKAGWPPQVHPQSATRNTMPYGVIAPPNGDSQPFRQNLFTFMMVTLETDLLPLQTKNIFFYGFVRYSTIFNEVFRMGFCFMYDRRDERWLLQGSDKYNYCRKEDGPEHGARS
jgi:hypothetical protein